MNPKKRQALFSLLEWYVDAGVDAALAETPRDRFAETARAAKPGAAPAVVPQTKPAAAAATPAPMVPGEDAVMLARQTAGSAATLEALRAILAEFEGCNLRRTAKNLVFSDGNPEARLMLVGEAPGREEDATGVPFVGRSGQMLDRMLAAIGLDRTQAYIANVVPWRPPGNRTPSPQETEICRPFIERQIELVNPDVLVFLGGAAAKQLLRTSQGIKRLRGRWMPYRAGEKEIRSIATLHPAYLLRDPQQKRHAWRDFLAIQAALRESPRA